MSALKGPPVSGFGGGDVLHNRFQYVVYAYTALGGGADCENDGMRGIVHEEYINKYSCVW